MISDRKVLRSVNARMYIKAKISAVIRPVNVTTIPDLIGNTSLYKQHTSRACFLYDVVISLIIKSLENGLFMELTRKFSSGDHDESFESEYPI